MDNGGDLLVIDNAQKQAHYSAILNTNSWIGLYHDLNDPNYSEPAGGWKWVDGTPLIYENWNGGEPNNSGQEDYGHFTGGNHQWNDLPLSSNLPFTMQLDKSAANSLTVSCFGGNDGSTYVTAAGGTTPYSYLWDDANSQTTDTAYNLSAGDYIITVTDASGCTAKDTATISEPDLITADTVYQDSVSCNGLLDGSATVLGLGGNGIYSYLWSDGQTTSTATNLAVGTYNVTITDQNNCSFDTTVTVLEPNVIAINNTSQDSVSCNGLFDGTASLTAIGGNGNYSYLWDASASSQTTNTAAGLSAGTYTVTVTDQKGCFKDTTVTVLEPNVIAINNTTQDSVSCNGLFDGIASVTAIGGNGIYSYLWSDGQTTSTAINLTAGTYNVTITDQKGCFKDTFVTVLEPDELLASASVVQDVLCFGESTGQASASLTGGNGNFSYLWSDGQTTVTATNLAVGTYTVTVTDQKGCSDDASVTIQLDPSSPAGGISSTDTQVACDSLTWIDGITYTASNNTATHTLTAANGCDSIVTLDLTINNSFFTLETLTECDSLTWVVNGVTYFTSGTYYDSSLTINNCDSVYQLDLTINTSPIIDLGTDTTLICAGTSETLDAGTGLASYLWSDGSTNQTLSASTTGTYTVIGTDANGCTVSDSMVIDVLTVDITQNDTTICEGDSLVLSLFKEFSVGDIGPAGGVIFYVNTDPNSDWEYLEASPKDYGNITDYSFSLRNWGCNGQTIGNTQTSLGSGEANTMQIINSCSDGNIPAKLCNDIIINGFDDWFLPSKDELGLIYTHVYLQNLANYKTGGFWSSSEINANNVWYYPMGSSSQPVSYTKNSSGGTSIGGGWGWRFIPVRKVSKENTIYLWSNNETTSSTTVQPIATTTYTVDVTSGTTTCQSDVTISVNQRDFVTVDSTVCDSIQWDGNWLTSSDSYVDTLQNTAGCDSIVTLNLTINQSTTGTDVLTACDTLTWIDGITYSTSNNTATHTLTNAAGCDSIVTLDLTIHTSPTVDLGLDTILCSGTTIDLDAGSGFTYLWNDATTNQTLTASSTGEYNVTITDGNGCTDSDTININLATPLVVTLDSTNITCNGESDGTATATVSGGTLPYGYNWSNGQTLLGDVSGTNTTTGLPQGNISITITDGKGCTASDNTIIAEPTLLSASMGIPTMVDCNGDNSGSVAVIASGGTVAGNYTYLWSDGQTTATATGLVAGDYTVTVTDDNNCQTIAGPVTITEPTAVSASMGVPTMVSCNGGSDGSVTVAASRGTVAGSYTYLWSDGQTTSTATGLVAGDYTVTVTDDNNCQTIAGPVTITEPTAVSASMGVPTMVSCNGGSDGSVTVAASGGTVAGSYTYLWSDGQTTSTATGLVAGDYTVTVTDDNNCQTIAGPVTITEPTAVSASMGVPTMVSCNGGSDGSVTVAASGGTVAGSYTYLWSDGQTTSTATGLVAGDYTVIVTDDNNCQTIAGPVTITEPNILSQNNTTNDVNCNGESDGSIDVVVTGGTAPYNISWTGAANGNPLGDEVNVSGGNFTMSGLSAGGYDITITDANNCQTSFNKLIFEPVLLTATISSSTNISCNGGSDGTATVNVAGGTLPYNYSWSNGQTLNGDITGTNSVNGLSQGNISITITDGNGCTATDNTNIIEPAVLTATATKVQDVQCNGAADGSISVSASGGTPNYTYLWDDGAGQTTTTATNLAPGNYTVTVTDDNGCTFTTPAVTITEPTALTATATKVQDVQCNGVADGIISVSASGGTPNYTYLWDDGAGQTTTTATNLAPGNYTVTVTDDNGCTFTTPAVTITEPTALTATATKVQDVQCNGAADGIISVSASGGTPNYTYLWDDGAGQTTTTAFTTNLAPGTMYNVMDRWYYIGISIRRDTKLHVFVG